MKPISESYQELFVVNLLIKYDICDHFLTQTKQHMVM